MPSSRRRFTSLPGMDNSWSTASRFQLSITSSTMFTGSWSMPEQSWSIPSEGMSRAPGWVLESRSSQSVRRECPSRSPSISQPCVVQPRAQASSRRVRRRGYPGGDHSRESVDRIPNRRRAARASESLTGAISPRPIAATSRTST